MNLTSISARLIVKPKVQAVYIRLRKMAQLSLARVNKMVERDNDSGSLVEAKRIEDSV